MKIIKQLELQLNSFKSDYNAEVMSLENKLKEEYFKIFEDTY